MANSARKLTRPPTFEVVRRVRRYEQVAEQIRKLIASGVFKSGDKLPSERELVSRLGVGRSSIRDAVRTLEAMGILEPRQGHGTVVRDFSADALVVPLASALNRKRQLISELLDARMDLLRESRAQALQVKGRPEQSFAGHRRILRAIERRDAKAAEAAVHKHLAEIERIVL